MAGDKSSGGKRRNGVKGGKADSGGKPPRDMGNVEQRGHVKGSDGRRRGTKKKSSG
jgi:hypothetical protein